MIESLDLRGPCGGSRRSSWARPDDGSRLSDEVPWDESNRPTHTGSAGRAYTETDNASPQHLVDIHDGLRSELTQLRDVLEQVRAVTRPSAKRAA